LNHESATTCRELDSAAAAGDTLENTPSLEEVRTALGKLRNERTASLDDISPELLKCAKEPISIALHTLFAKVWITGKVPADWRDTIIVSLYEGKGSKSNYASTDLYLCCLYQAKCSLMFSSVDYSWSLNGGCYSCFAASVRVVQKIVKASACGLI